MRGYYLYPSDDSRRGLGSRGGVGSKDCDYDLEIGQLQTCSFDMMALCVHIDEILEFLNLSDSPISKMILESYRMTIHDIDEQYQKQVAILEVKRAEIVAAGGPEAETLVDQRDE